MKRPQVSASMSKMWLLQRLETGAKKFFHLSCGLTTAIARRLSLILQGRKKKSLLVLQHTREALSCQFRGESLFLDVDVILTLPQAILSVNEEAKKFRCKVFDPQHTAKYVVRAMDGVNELAGEKSFFSLRAKTFVSHFTSLYPSFVGR